MEATVTIVITLILLQDKVICATHSRSATSLLEFNVAAWHATTYGFQISGRKRRDEYKLETACCDRFGSAGSAFCGQRRGTSIL